MSDPYKDKNDKSSVGTPIMLKTYQAASTLLDPVAKATLKRRLKAGKEDPKRVEEKRGYTSKSRPEGKLIWIHGASVGESFSVLPLVKRLKAETGATLLVTTGTITSASLMKERLPESAIHQFAPLDHPDYVNRFLDHWQPDASIFVESELWPNLIQLTSSRDIPIALVNGRISPSSYKKWKQRPSSIRTLMNSFNVIMAQDTANAERIRTLSDRNVEMFGNLKMAASPLPAVQSDLAEFETLVKERPIWLAASTHQGEEEEIIAAHMEVAKTYPDLLTIIAPRHPNRGAEIAQYVWEQKLICAQRSLGEPLTSKTHIYIADTLGELGLFYRVTDIAFIGGSIVETGGHNPLEPARLKTSILYGPHIFNFADTFKDMRAAGGTALVRDGRDLAAALIRLLTDDMTRDEMATRAEEWSRQNAEEVLNKIIDALKPILPKVKEP